jgi:hypothetical protein
LSEKEKEGNIENVISLKEPSPATMAHFKIKVACTPYKPTDTFNL